MKPLQLSDVQSGTGVNTGETGDAKKTHQITPIFSSCDDVNLALIEGEFRDIDWFRTHRPMIWLNLFGNNFLFDRGYDSSQRKVGCCAGEKFLLSLQGLVTLPFAKLLQTILDNDLMVGLEFRLGRMSVFSFQNRNEKLA